MKLQEIAVKITEHLRRFELDPEVNKRSTSGVVPYRNAHARANGSWVSVTYVSYHPHSSLTKAEAERYLAWLDAGNVGRHNNVPPVEADASEDDVACFYVEIEGSRPVIRKLLGRRTKKLVKFAKYTSRYGSQAPIGDVVTDPAEAARRWQASMREKAEELEQRAAEARALAAMTPELET